MCNAHIINITGKKTNSAFTVILKLMANTFALVCDVGKNSKLANYSIALRQRKSFINHEGYNVFSIV